MPSSVVCRRPFKQAPESPRRKGAGAKENTTKSRLAGPAAGQYCNGVARGGVGLLLPHPVGVRLTHGGMSELYFGSSG